MAKFWFMSLALMFGVSLASAPLAAQDDASTEAPEATEEMSVASTGGSTSTSVSLGEGGLNYSTENDAFSMRVSTRVEFRMTYNDENGSGDGGAVPGPANTDARDYWAFQVPRAETTFAGHIFEKKWQYNLTLDWANNQGQMIKKATFRWAGDKFYNVTIGQDKLQFNWQEINSSGKQMFVDRSLVNEQFNLDYAKGITVDGEYADDTAVWAKYWIGVYNGILRSNTDYRNADRAGLASTFNALGGADADLMFNVRVETYPLGEFTREGRDARGDDEKENPLFSVGLAFNWLSTSVNAGVLRSGATAGSGRNQAGQRTMSVALDAHLRWFGANLDIELIHRRTEYFNTGALNTTESLQARPTDITDTGVIIEAGYMLAPDMQIGIRAGLNDQDEYVFGTADGFALAHDSTEIGVVFNYFIHGDNLKVSVDLNYVDFQLARATGALGFNNFDGTTTRSPSSIANNVADHATFWQFRAQVQWIF